MLFLFLGIIPPKMIGNCEARDFLAWIDGDDVNCVCVENCQFAGLGK
jgi:hypothetical protein